jgi:hypothetical protein
MGVIVVRALTARAADPSAHSQTVIPAQETSEPTLSPTRLPLATILPAAIEQPSPRKPAPLARRVRKTTGKFAVKRRLALTEQDLLKQIEKTPEVGLDTSWKRFESTRAVVAAEMHARVGRETDETTLFLLEERDDLKGLPLRKGTACKLPTRNAQHLEQGSIALRELSGHIGAGLEQALRNTDGKYKGWGQSESIPTLVQILMADVESNRIVLVSQLAAIEDREASEALARRALFDLHPRVRASAIEALRKRPVEQYLDILLSGFAHPWPAVADHAAEAIGSLDLEQAVPRLLNLLDAPHPAAPYQKPNQQLFVKEMVRINHLSNCLMCHAPSLKQTDKVRGRVPPTTAPLPPANSRAYYESNEGIFVRADITYLKQDFSVPMVVTNPGHWPKMQRFDFLVRERRTTEAERRAWVFADSRKPTEHQQALMFALRELTGEDPGPSVDDWRKYREARAWSR